MNKDQDNETFQSGPVRSSFTYTRLFARYFDDFCSIVQIAGVQYEMESGSRPPQEPIYKTILVRPEGEPYKPIYRLDAEPFLKMRTEDVQLFFDNLWSIGFRPSNWPKMQKEIKALEDHLVDMRDFARRLLTIVEKVGS